MKNQNTALDRASLKGFRKGIKVAATLADEYNSLSLHGFKLGDCIQGKLNFSRRHPRRNPTSPALLAGCKRKLLEVKITDQLVMQMAMTIAPEFWAEYVENKGRVANMVGWECLESIEIAKRLIAAGFRDCAPSRPGLPKMLEPAARRTARVRKGSARRPRNRGA